MAPCHGMEYATLYYLAWKWEGCHTGPPTAIKICRKTAVQRCSKNSFSSTDCITWPGIESTKRILLCVCHGRCALWRNRKGPIISRCCRSQPGGILGGILLSPPVINRSWQSEWPRLRNCSFVAEQDTVHHFNSPQFYCLHWTAFHKCALSHVFVWWRVEVIRFRFFLELESEAEL